jgi:hypothetical protein
MPKKDDNTSRYAPNAVDTALRKRLKVAAKGKPKQNKTKQVRVYHPIMNRNVGSSTEY